MKNLVIIPTYNEIENITNIISTTFKFNFDIHILIVDDNSPDGTSEKVKDLFLLYENKLFLLNRKKKEGLGTAYVAGFKWAIDRNYNNVIEMDADFSHNPIELKNFISKLNSGYDFVIGSRYVKNGRITNWPLLRRFYSKSASVITRFMIGLPIKDPTSGFVAYNIHALKCLNFSKIRFVGYAFQIEMKYKLWILEKKYIEIPITFQDRKIGQSKMSFKIISEAIFALLCLPKMNNEILNIKKGNSH